MTIGETGKRMFELRIGDYIITQLREGSFWLKNGSGDGFEINEDDFEKFLKDIFEENVER